MNSFSRGAENSIPMTRNQGSSPVTDPMATKKRAAISYAMIFIRRQPLSLLLHL
ncbi:hypothetical protein [Rhizobium leguminosarum]